MPDELQRVGRRDKLIDEVARVSERGIIDLSGVSLGDPDYDCASLFIDIGKEFVVEVARRC